MVRVGLVALVLVVLGLGGCTAPEVPMGRAPMEPFPPEEAPPSGWTSPLPVSDPPATLAIPLRVEMAWMRPYQPTAVEAPEGVRPDWYVELEGAEAGLFDGGSRLFVRNASAPGHPSPPHSGATLGVLPGDGERRALRVPDAGRHVMDAAGARLVVFATPSAPRDAQAQVHLVADADGPRFVPAEATLHPETPLVLRSHLGHDARLQEVGFWPLVAAEAQRIGFTPADEGLYVLHAFASSRPLPARGSAKILADLDKPTPRVTGGPIEGRFDAPPPFAGRSAGFLLDLRYPVRSLDVWFNASTMLPVPGSVRVEVTREGVPVAEASSAETSRISLVDLPAGLYRIAVTAEKGAFVSYEIRGEALLDLPLPDRLREA